MLREEGWRYRVYHSGDEEYDKKSWKQIRKEVIRSDNYTCQACGTKKNLTVHHIIPRDKGGPDDTSNLITLCTRCHDEIEIAISEGEWLFSRNVIMGYFDEYNDYEEQEKVAPDKRKWHMWVYGAYRRPK